MKENARNVYGLCGTRRNAVSSDVGTAQIVAMLKELGRPRRLKYRVLTLTICDHVFVGVQKVRLSLGDCLSKPKLGVGRKL